MSSLFFHAPLSAPAEFVGTVDASSERSTPCPRTLHQAFGEHAEHCHIVPMATEQRVHQVDAAVGWFCLVVGGGALVVFSCVGWMS